MTKKFSLNIGPTIRCMLAGMFAASALWLPVSAETVSRREAQQIAVEFFNVSGNPSAEAPEMAWNGRQLTTARLFPPFYIFNNRAGGFVIIAADNKAFPVLGFSPTGTFRQDKLSDTEREWLRRYAMQIEAVRYDSRVPYDAIAQWTDIAGTIGSILEAPSRSEMPHITASKALERLETSLAAGNDISSASTLYTTAQWNELISTELARRGNVVLGLLADDSVIPVIIHGRKGDFFRVFSGAMENAQMRLFATEYLTDGQYALLANPPALPPENPEERPFAFYDDEILPMTAAAVGNNLSVSPAGDTPRVESIGDGHFFITFPVPVNLAEIYSVAGAKVRAYKYNSLPGVAVDISAEAPGFYVALFHTPGGRTYGLKLMR